MCISAWLQGIGSGTWQNITKICKRLWLSRWEIANHISPVFSNLFYFCQNGVPNLDLCFLEWKQDSSGGPYFPSYRYDADGDAVCPGPGAIDRVWRYSVLMWTREKGAGREDAWASVVLNFLCRPEGKERSKWEPSAAQRGVGARHRSLSLGQTQSPSYSGYSEFSLFSFTPPLLFFLSLILSIDQVHLQQAHPHLPPSSCQSQKSLRAVPVTLFPSHMVSESFPPSAPATSEQPEKLFFRMERTIHAW